MGLRQVLQHRERSEIMALPYATADARAAQDQRTVEQKPPRVYEVPTSWRMLTLYLFTLSVYLQIIL